jgi:hypothetical protein
MASAIFAGSSGTPISDGSVEIHLNFGDAAREVIMPGPRRVLLSTIGQR